MGGGCWSFPSTSVELGSTGCVGIGNHWDRGALGQGSRAALLLIQTQLQNKTLGKNKQREIAAVLCQGRCGASSGNDGTCSPK